MDTPTLIAATDALSKRVNEELARGTKANATGLHAEVCEFLRLYASPRSQFLKMAEGLGGYATLRLGNLSAVLSSFRAFVEAGLHEAISPERRAQLDVVSDLLEQAQQLLETKGVHPASPAMLIGAVLEEYLRTWVENEGLSLGNRKRSLAAYSDVLREAELITKQDAKDITSWAGLRNHAAHGEWAEVEDVGRVRVMLDGVNLFMRKYGV